VRRVLGRGVPRRGLALRCRGRAGRRADEPVQVLRNVGNVVDHHAVSTTVRPAIAALGAAVAVSPYLWLHSWQATGFSTAYLPYHVWCCVPFVVLALLAKGRAKTIALGGLALAGTVVAILLAQSLNADDRVAGIALTGILTLVIVGVSVRWGILALVAAAIVAGRVAQVGDLDRVQTFLVIGTSIVVEALPFVLLGAAVSAAIEVFVPDRWFARIARLPLPLQIPSVALAGIAMPVCECGSVPVARRLIVRGVHPSAGIAFMLAAPVINPVVLLSTAVAYRGRGAAEMVAGRAILGLIVAIVVGTLVARAGAGKVLPDDSHDDHHHHHSVASGFVGHLSSDLLLMGRFIVLGAALAAAMQTLVPQSVFTGVLTSPLLGALIMVALAFFLSLCSEADAFVAVSFIQFPLGPQLAFLTAGPVLDTKLALLYGGTFGRGFVLRLALVAIPVVVAGSMLFQAVVA
jgi:uncharacterized protein